MLDLDCFSTAPEAIEYYGASHYCITMSCTGYAVHVTTLDDNGNAIPGESYAAPTLSAAVAIIERLEAGEAE